MKKILPSLKTVTTLALVTAVAVAVALSDRTLSQSANKSALAGKPSPDWTLKDLNGKPISLSQLKGKVVVLNFWATWCPPCVAEIPDFIATHEKYRERDVVFLGISLDQSVVPVGRFVKAKKIPYPIMMGTPQVVAAYGNFQAIPHTVILDREGHIQIEHSGLLRKKALESHIETLLARKTSS